MKLTIPPKDCAVMGLNPGVIYDRRYLRFVGFVDESGNAIDDDGGYDMSCDSWWDFDGRYGGPDTNGIVPMYEYQEAKEEEEGRA
jgi:hypothetical protein